MFLPSFLIQNRLGVLDSRGGAENSSALPESPLGSTGHRPVPSGDPPDGMEPAVISPSGRALHRLAFWQFQSAGRRPGRAGRPHHPVLRQAEFHLGTLTEPPGPLLSILCILSTRVGGLSLKAGDVQAGRTALRATPVFGFRRRYATRPCQAAVPPVD